MSFELFSKTTESDMPQMSTCLTLRDQCVKKHARRT